MVSSFIKQLLLKCTPEKLKALYLKEHFSKSIPFRDFETISYSQEGEDLILKRFFGEKADGFYIDIGAHHPYRFSNTYLFYKKGWNGINIDPLPGAKEKFQQERPRDINLEIGVSSQEQELVYYMFNEPALNTFSKLEAQKKDGLGIYRIIDKKSIKTIPLRQIFQIHLPSEIIIDFMTIDVEGLDLEVLQSSDWNLYRPRIVLVEDLKKQSLESFIKDSELYKFLCSQNYSFTAKSYNTLFFKDNLN